MQYMNISLAPRLPSERRFGFTLGAALAVCAVYGIFRHWRWIAYGGVLIGSATFCAVALAIPPVLAPLNRAWRYLGEQLGKVISPIVLAVIFFGLLTPITVITRLFGRDARRLKRGAAKTYWIRRESSASVAHTFKNQF